MKRLSACLAIIVLLVLTACGGDDPSPEATLPAPDSQPALMPDNQPGYPSPATPSPASADEAYPPPSPTPLTSGYPEAEGVWVIRPVAEQQCTDDGSAPPKTYPDVDAAVAALEENGITVSASGTVGLVVCEACSCPTSEHYRLRIPPEDLDAALTLGWTEEE